MSAATPTVYFIDDSATMREVIKIAFRRENINVIACHDAASAFSEIEQTAPDVVISDVIMPDKDGYDVCQYIKHHPKFSAIPVILMSGVVNRSVAEKAFAVKADELIRKPFQPQDLITRVKHLLRSGEAAAPTPVSATSTAAALSSIFAQASVGAAIPGNGGVGRRPAAPAPPAQSGPASVSPLAAAFAGALPASPAAPAPAPAQRAAAPPPPAAPVPAASAPRRPAAAPSPMDPQKLKFEIMRLETIVKKLQADLEAERQYSRALEDHIKTLQEGE